MPALDSGSQRLTTGAGLRQSTLAPSVLAFFKCSTANKIAEHLSEDLW